MTTKIAWWECIFEGSLAPGFNKERLPELENETFLYFEKKQNAPIHHAPTSNPTT